MGSVSGEEIERWMQVSAWLGNGNAKEQRSGSGGLWAIPTPQPRHRFGVLLTLLSMPGAEAKESKSALWFPFLALNIRNLVESLFWIISSSWDSRGTTEFILEKFLGSSNLDG